MIDTKVRRVAVFGVYPVTWHRLRNQAARVPITRCGKYASEFMLSTDVPPDMPMCRGCWISEQSNDR